MSRKRRTLVSSAKAWTPEDEKHLVRRWDELKAQGYSGATAVQALVVDFPSRSPNAIYVKFYELTAGRNKSRGETYRAELGEPTTRSRPEQQPPHNDEQIEQLEEAVMGPISDFIEAQCETILSRMTEARKENKILRENNKKLEAEINSFQHKAKPSYKQKLTELSHRMLARGGETNA